MTIQENQTNMSKEGTLTSASAAKSRLDSRQRSNLVRSQQPETLFRRGRGEMTSTALRQQQQPGSFKELEDPEGNYEEIEPLTTNGKKIKK